METLRIGSTRSNGRIFYRIYLYNSKIDGIFGPNLKNAVIQFQRQNGLTADGIVGPRTWFALQPYID